MGRSNVDVRICLVSSRGGHLEQMRRLQPVYGAHDHFLVSTAVGGASSKIAGFARTYYVAEMGEGRWKRHPFRLILVFLHFLGIFVRERPDFVISTGSGVAVPAFLAARITGAKTVFIEAGARIKGLSLAGRVCYRLADLFLVQHPGLVQAYPRAIYRGSLYEHLFG